MGKVFRDGAVPLDLRLNKWNGLNSSYITGFRHAADLIAASFDDKHPSEYDVHLFYPLLALYRHAFELQLKEIVRLGVEIGALSETPESVKHHGLTQLWESARQAVVEVWHDHAEILDPVGEAIAELNHADQSGQESRYSVTKKGELSLQNLPEQVSLTEMEKSLGAAFDFLSGCLSGFETAWGNLHQNQ